MMANRTVADSKPTHTHTQETCRLKRERTRRMGAQGQFLKLWRTAGTKASTVAREATGEQHQPSRQF